jgi:hypothetical protein
MLDDIQAAAASLVQQKPAERTATLERLRPLFTKFQEEM